ncbi:hypothetical protein BBJ28_00026673, partial [Nothophytophthora sp. Chile5]
RRAPDDSIAATEARPCRRPLRAMATYVDDAPPPKRRSPRKSKKRSPPPPLFALDSAASSEFPTGSSSSSSVVGPLAFEFMGGASSSGAGFDQSSNSNASTASQMTSTSSTSAGSSSRGVRWWKRVAAMRPTRRRSGSHDAKERSSLDQELYVRSILESYASSLSSNRYSAAAQFSADGSSSNSEGSKPSSGSHGFRAEKLRDGEATEAAGGGRARRKDDDALYVAHSTPNGAYEADVEAGERRVDVDRHHLTAGMPGLSSGSSGGREREDEENPFGVSSVSDEDDRNRRRLQRRIKIEAMRSKLLEKNQHRARADDDSSDSSAGSSISTDMYTYVHCILMVISLWMSLVVVIMHVTFRSFRTYSHPFVLELSCVQCGYWITSLLRVVFETSSLADMAYLFFCMAECFFNFAQISFTCAI